MKCNEIRELLPELVPELATRMNASTAEEVRKHIATCEACSAHLRELQNTMTLLDEWQAPEPSAYFDTRLQARLREEMARPQAGFMQWLRRPAWSISLAAVLFAGALRIGVNNTSYFSQLETIATKPPSPGPPVQPGTAVGDLQALDRNDDLYADFDVLDQLQVQDDVTANP
jgi:predicted anti-sigma-YlaC factor YlaD